MWIRLCCRVRISSARSCADTIANSPLSQAGASNRTSFGLGLSEDYYDIVLLINWQRFLSGDDETKRFVNCFISSSGHVVMVLRRATQAQAHSLA